MRPAIEAGLKCLCVELRRWVGPGFRSVCENRGRKPQVPPLRYAPVGMTILLQGQAFLAEALASTTELSSRPERSVVEGPAVSLPILEATFRLSKSTCLNFGAKRL
jgi:hypothetical protein